MSSDNSKNHTAGGVVIKTESGSPGLKHERLTSFKLPRDLTLGSLGIKSTRGAPKKVVAPNLNVVRNKNVDVKTSRDTSVRGRGRGERGGKSERGRGGKRASTLMQTAGLFSEGTAAVPSISRSNSRSSARESSSSSTRDSVSQMRRPTISRHDREMKIDYEDEKRHLEETLPTNVDDDFNDKSSINGGVPIKLANYKPKVKLERIELKVEKVESGEGMADAARTEMIVDDEGLMVPVKNEKSEFETDTAIKTEYEPEEGYPEMIEQFFRRQTPQLFLLQLPDTLPGRGPAVEPAESAEFESAEASDPVSTFCTVKQLEEGLVGKVLRYRSGRTKLVLGDMRFDIDLGMNPGFLQELVSINTNREERSGNLINLGPLQAKLHASPDWEHIMRKGL